jgi:XTP/dITP diphosphohydrolase
MESEQMTLYIATSNPGKLRDFAAVATPDISIAPLPGLDEIAAPHEDQTTFEGNARLKAIYYSRYAPGAIVIADDSGLEVDALQGAPGVRSARYAADYGFDGPPSSAPASFTPDERNNLYLLQSLNGISRESRSARYRCVIAAARDGGVLSTGNGPVEGRILTAPRGTGGFGYDPLFYLPEYGKTMAELDIAVKLAFSHRGRAFRALLEALAENVKTP